MKVTFPFADGVVLAGKDHSAGHAFIFRRGFRALQESLMSRNQRK